MVRRIGRIESLTRSPHVYFIEIASRFLYIGETQSSPVIRWGQHLGTGGTLLERLTQADEEVAISPGRLYFFGYECEEIARSVPAPERKTVTQYVEHQLHVCAISDPHIGTRLELLSDTSRTAPRRCRYTFVSGLITELFSAFRADRTTSGKRLPRCASLDGARRRRGRRLHWRIGILRLAGLEPARGRRKWALFACCV